MAEILDPDSEVGYDETLHDGIQESMTIPTTIQGSGVGANHQMVGNHGVFQRRSTTGWCYTRQ